MIAIYARVSTQEQAQNGHSIDEQIERMEKYCDAMGWGTRKSYIDAGFSGAKTDRPMLQSMIRDIKTQNIEKVIVYKLDRLSRSQKDTLMLIEDVFLANNCDFVSMSENFDTSTPLGRAMIGILAVFAQLEREQIKERMRMGMEARAKQGYYCGGKIPIGYTYEDDELIINDYEAMQVQRVFEEYIKGTSPLKIVNLMDNLGFEHNYGKWTEITVRNVLHQRLYTGEISFAGVWHKGRHAPIITTDTFDRAQKILAQKHELSKINKSREGVACSYLAGLLFCKKCGARYSRRIMSSCGGKYKYIYYSCNSRTKRRQYAIKDPNCKNKNWRCDTLDQIVFDAVKSLKFEDSAEFKPDDQSPIILSEISKLETQISKLMDLYSMDSVPVDILQDKIKALSDQKAKLALSLEQPEVITRSEAMTIAESLTLGDIDETRDMFKALISRIDIDEEDIYIHWAFN